MPQTAIDPWRQFAAGPDRNAVFDRSFFFCCYNISMSEHPKRSKERSKEIRTRARDIMRVAALSAGILAGATDEERARRIAIKSQDLKSDQSSVMKPYPGWHRSENVEDRRLDISSGPLFSFAERSPDKVINIDTEARGLAADAGANDIARSPADIMRESLFNQGKEILKVELNKKMKKSPRSRS